MINRIAIKTGDISLKNEILIIGKDNFLEVPLSSIQAIEFYPSTELNAGYLAVVKNNFNDADIIFFHKQFENQFKLVYNEVNTKLQQEPKMILSDEEYDKMETLESEVISKLLSYSKDKGHEFTNGSQRIEARELILLVRRHLKDGAFAHLDRKELKKTEE